MALSVSLLLPWFGTGSLAVEPAEIVPGDSRESVEERLGPPQSFFKMGERQFLYYPRGHVEFTNDVVAEVVFQSEETLQAAADRREQIRIQRERAEAKTAARRKDVGMRELAAKLRDPAFSSAPAAERVTFWESFAGNYPEVPVAAEYHQALLDLSNEQREAVAEVEDRSRMAKLEQRVADAHAEALRAEEDAALARIRAAEAEREALLVREEAAQESVPAVPTVVEEVIYYDPIVYNVPAPPREPQAPKPPPAGRFDIDRRLGPMDGKPAFGGTK